MGGAVVVAENDTCLPEEGVEDWFASTFFCYGMGAVI
jgi:hypothetical protein